MQIRKGRQDRHLPQASTATIQPIIQTSDVIVFDWIRDLIRPRTEIEQANLTADIKTNGLSTPITLSNIEGTPNVLIDGHGRLASCQELEIEKIPYEIKDFENQDQLQAWIYRKQLGRRNLSHQDRAKIIGSLPESKSQIAEGLEVSTTYVAECRRYCKALNWLTENKDIGNLSELPVSTVIKQFDNATSTKNKSDGSPYTQSVQGKKAVTWKINEDLLMNFRAAAKANGNSITQQIENVMKEYLESNT